MVVSRSLAFATGLMGAVAASQIPEFGQQYRQRLGGAIDELRAVADRFDIDAREAQLGRAEAIARLRANPDTLVQRRALDAEKTASRLRSLERQRDRMVEAGAFGRVVAMAENADTLVMRGAFQSFEPAAPLTMEGAVAAGLGFLGGYGLVRLAAAPFGRRRGRKIRVPA